MTEMSKPQQSKSLRKGEERSGRLVGGAETSKKLAEGRRVLQKIGSKMDLLKLKKVSSVPKYVIG